MSKIKVGIIGCGTIGTQLAIACQGRLAKSVELVAVCDFDAGKAAALNKSLKKKVRLLKIGDLMGKADVVVEAASAGISGDVLKECIRRKKGCLIMSVGGLLGREDLLKKAEKLGVRVYIPSGAICGIDGLKSSSVGKIDSVTLTTRKPPKGLFGAPYLKEKGIDITNISEDRTVFEGSAEEAVRAFPQNINVSAVLSLAGIGAKATRVRLVASPGLGRNVHEVEIRGDAGSIFTRTENVPSKANPKTSALAILSAIATLGGISDSVKIGT